MALEGSLKDFELADILQLIHQQKKTGVLKMKTPDTEAQVLFENGLVVSADPSGSGGVNGIGDLLFRAGKITEEVLQQVNRTHQTTGANIGNILIESGAVTREDLLGFLDRHMKESVLGLFKWKEGQYRFEPSDVSYEREYTTPVSTEFLIIEGVRRADEWPGIERKVSNPGMVFEKRDDNAPKPKVAAAAEGAGEVIGGETGNPDELRITPEEMTVYELVDGLKEVRRIIDLTSLGEFETCKALANLMTAGLIVLKSSSAAQAPVEPIPSSEAADIQTPMPLPEAKESARPAMSIRSARPWISIFMMAAFIAVMGLGVKSFSRDLVQVHDAMTFFQDMAANNKVRALRFSILTYYYANKQLPASLEVLVQQGYFPENTASALEERGLSYQPDSEANGFRLSIKK